MAHSTNLSINDTTANPAPLGLLGFGLTTVLLNLHNAGIIPFDAMILAMGIFYGGIGQVIVGIMEWKKNNTFGATAFTSYGLFWLSLVALILLPQTGYAAKPSSASMVAFLTMWGLFSFALFIGTFKLNRKLQVVFGSLVVLFFLLVLSDATGNPQVKILAGYEGIFCGFTAMYTGLSQVLGELYATSLAPVKAKAMSALFAEENLEDEESEPITAS